MASPHQNVIRAVRYSVSTQNLKCNGTGTETTFRLSAKWMSTFKSAGPAVRSTTGSRGVCISGSNGSVVSRRENSVLFYSISFVIRFIRLLAL